MDNRAFVNFKDYLLKIPSIQGPISQGSNEEGMWWVKFSIDIEHPLAWNVVQELGYILNYLSLEERLPTLFMPISPSPYLNGGPKEYLSWVIECKSKGFSPNTCTEWLQTRLPNPVDDESQWYFDE